MKPHYDVLVPGDYFCDVIFTGLPTFPALGQELYTQDVKVVPGGPLNNVVALRRLRVNVGWASDLGTDFFSQFIAHYVRNEGIDSSLITWIDQPLRRVTVALSYPADRAFITRCDPGRDVAEMAFEALYKATFNHVHFTGLSAEERTLEFYDACRERGIEVSTDCQHSEDTLDVPLIREIISRVDLFMPNASEAMHMTHTANIPAALEALGQIVPYVVIKNGAGGAYARRESVNYFSPALHVIPIDTTGAGDVFNAGFLAAHLEGHDPEECLRWGNFCGAQSVLGAGGTTTAPTRAALEEWLSSGAVIT